MVTSPQRAYRAACPHCGAAVEFASAASASAVCSYCRSTLVRDGDALRRIGVSAELFDDHTPLQLGASGRRQGIGFTLVGRLQYGYSAGSWNEWHALFDNGRSAWLSEDNGAYVLAFDAAPPADAPPLADLRAGSRVLADGRAWDVASVVSARLIAAEGELPAPPRLQGDFIVCDLRNPAGEVATLHGSDPARLGWSVGRSVTLAELAMQGLKDIAEKTLGARAPDCPSCGAPLAITLASTRSVVCGQCAAVVEVSQGLGADLAHYQQNNAGVRGAEPLIPLGSTALPGHLALGGPPLRWQVVGYLERCTVPGPGDDETSFWREYLLYEREAGFAFLVDTDEGWSWVRPLTGAPAVQGNEAAWEGVRYRQRWRYAARVTWVQGEFYWRLQRDEHALVTDYEGRGGDAARRLSREQTRDEVTWSAGVTLAASAVADAFAISASARPALQRDAAPLAGYGSGPRTALLLIVCIIVIIVLLARCGGSDCDGVRSTFGPASREYQECLARDGAGGYGTRGGSFGGWSSGGGHK